MLKITDRVGQRFSALRQYPSIHMFVYAFFAFFFRVHITRYSLGMRHVSFVTPKTQGNKIGMNSSQLSACKRNGIGTIGTCVCASVYAVVILGCIRQIRVILLVGTDNRKTLIDLSLQFRTSCTRHNGNPRWRPLAASLMENVGRLSDCWPMFWREEREIVLLPDLRCFTGHQQDSGNAKRDRYNRQPKLTAEWQAGLQNENFALNYVFTAEDTSTGFPVDLPPFALS